jgi:uncharacterized DUF497 family protein
MDFDWALYDASQKPGRDEIEEAFEDPFGLRLLPDARRFEEQSRFFALGRDDRGGYWTVVYGANGKLFRVIAARPMSDEERAFYERKLRESL